MNDKIISKGVKVELFKSCIFLTSKYDNAYWDFVDEDYAKKVWNEIKDKWRKQNYYCPSGIENWILTIIEKSEHLKNVTDGGI